MGRVRASFSLFVLLAIAAVAVSAQSRKPRLPGRFTVVEATMPEMQAAMRQGRVTSRQIVTEYLTRIAIANSRLHAAIAIDPDALAEADARDRERAAGRVRGPLHGIPIALKDNIQTTNMPTSGGALAFEGFVPAYEATLAANLRAAGAIIIAKTGMTELANWVAGAPPAMGVGGSSSGIGTTANLWAANVGTETSGSILSPANQTMLAAVKPTVGRVSRYGVIPITADQDTAGPLAKSVVDAATLLGALEGPVPDPHDPATRRCMPPPRHDFTAGLTRGALKGARIGIPRAFFYDRAGLFGESPGLNVDQARVMADAVAVLKKQGAVVVDPADIPSVVDPRAENNFLSWGICSGAAAGRAHDSDCSTVLKYGMKRDFNAWLASLGPLAPIKTLAELRAWNVEHKDAGTLKYGQANLDISDEMDVDRDRARYEADRAKDLRLAATDGIDQVLTADHLDALLFPGPSGAAIAARAGYPTVIVPFGFIPNAPAPPFPPGFDAKPQPFGVSFSGTACSEPRLLQLAYDFEQATARRMPPPW
jgi:amidase